MLIPSGFNSASEIPKFERAMQSTLPKPLCHDPCLILVLCVLGPCFLLPLCLATQSPSHAPAAFLSVTCNMHTQANHPPLFLCSLCLLQPPATPMPICSCFAIKPQYKYSSLSYSHSHFVISNETTNVCVFSGSSTGQLSALLFALPCLACDLLYSKLVTGLRLGFMFQLCIFFTSINGSFRPFLDP